MEGYAVLVEEAGFSEDAEETENKDGLIFFDAKSSQDRYAIPSAFAAYAKYIEYPAWKRAV